MTLLEQLANKLNNAVVSGDAAALKEIDQQLEEAAFVDSGVPLHVLTDENGTYDNDSQYALYWQIRSSMLAQVYMAAAIQLTHFPQLQKAVDL